MREKQRQGWTEKGGSSFSDKTFCQRRDKFSHGIQARGTFQRQCRHERRTGCLAPPPLPNSEVFCQVERGEEVIGRQRCHPPIISLNYPLFVAKTIFLDYPLFVALKSDLFVLANLFLFRFAGSGVERGWLVRPVMPGRKSIVHGRACPSWILSMSLIQRVFKKFCLLDARGIALDGRLGGLVCCCLVDQHAGQSPDFDKRNVWTSV